MHGLPRISTNCTSAREIQDAVVARLQRFSEGQQGAAAAVTSTLDFFKNNAVGVMELAGVQRETMQDQLNSIPSNEKDDIISSMRESSSYLLGESRTNLEWLSYSMANVLKDVGDERAVTKYDIQAGAKLVSRLFSTQEGLAAGAELNYRFDVRSAQSHQMIYQNELSTPEQKARSGKLLAQTVNPDIPSNLIITSPKTGQVFLFANQEHLDNFKNRVNELGLLHKPVDKVLEAFPKNLRPMTLDSAIESSRGWLMPERNDDRFYSRVSGKQ
jgi:hypothetical protein